MNIAQVLQTQKDLGENQGFWEYTTIEGEIICYVVRIVGVNGKKSFYPLTFQDGKWVKKWYPMVNYERVPKPIYNIRSLVINPDKPVLIVEGEKTADAGKYFFPEFNVITWMGGSQSIKAIQLDMLENKDIYLFPDNDESSFNAMDNIYERLRNKASCLRLVDVRKLGVSKGWDIADIEHGEVDLEDVKQLVRETQPVKKQFEFPEMSEGKKPYPLDVTENLKYLLDWFGIVVKWNMMKREREIVFPGKIFYNEEAANESLTIITNLAVKHGFNIRRIDKHLDAIAFEHRFHPIRDWITSKPVSDRGIFDKFLSVLKTTNDNLSKMLLRKWLLSAVATVFNESDYRAQGVLVLQGKGGWRKTTFLASLVPNEMDAIFTGANLDPSNKDSILTLSEYWIAELGELGSTFKKSDIDKLKAYITQAKDTVRRPFAAKNSKMLRRTIFAASVNEENFLVDETGNRRWWVISLTEKINTEHNINMQQVWRCAYDLWLSGEQAYLNDAELEKLNDSNEEFETINPYLEKINERFDFSEPCDRWLAPSIVLEIIGVNNPSKGEATRMGALLTKMGVDKKRSKHTSLYKLPVLKNKYR